MLGNKQYLEELLKERNGLEVHSIHFVHNHLFSKKPQAQLEALGLGSFEPIYFSVTGDIYCKDGALNTNSNLNGCTISIKVNESIMQVILLQKDFPLEETIDDEYQEEWTSMLQLIALAHELGHVEDMQLISNSNFTYGDVPDVNLVEAEAYAHSYCLTYLNSVKAYTARNTLASALYQMHTSKKQFEKKLYRSICDRIGKKRIKKWSNA